METLLCVSTFLCLRIRFLKQKNFMCAYFTDVIIILACLPNRVKRNLLQKRLNNGVFGLSAEKNALCFLFHNFVLILFFFYWQNKQYLLY